ncbi:hypothetical protein GUITHDRAFT_112105 [Guillardia theta CCMP2712]|uniref:Uncharacterized protein n=2 Tax=Guillardia theta TaxID=55529 RepID=L1J0B8_GUITC|nr:hypothetical protein GUITHDRAFT_112105 [Guillardia theta CCMP2712]EKX41973.1 hypothetical protein GUITHDRAFT_112105 [Guillardia theta CCMP2712]|mmetsp:Transcript_43344/g.137038  ORF Transcript_43344/g.137038 Transcript_43344/m.137038 type:complete len:237 (+) Transcript_43344:248-958(+)|eukprot:XP_005828953.1 hypothetical protein GUITHDRAFT_112105 [Guillardia theta CCMP2712]
MLFAIDEAWVTVEKVWEDRGLVAHPSFQSLKGSAKLHKLEINARMMGQAGVEQGEATGAHKPLPVRNDLGGNRNFAEEFDLFMRRHGKRRTGRNREEPGRQKLQPITMRTRERALAATWAPISKAECGKAFDGNNSKKILLGVQLARNEMEAAAQARLAKNMRELRMFVEEFEMKERGGEKPLVLPAIKRDGKGNAPEPWSSRQKKLTFDIDPVNRNIASQMEDNVRNIFQQLRDT